MATIAHEDEGTHRSIRLAGELDHHGCRDVGAAFEAAAGDAAADVVVDLDGVTFAGSLAVRMLLRANEAVRRKGHRLLLARPRPHIVAMLDRVGALKVLGRLGSPLPGSA